MPLQPNEISGSQLPTGARGYRRDATDDLLKRVAWDYSQLTHEIESLLEEARTLKQRNEELEAQTVALQTVIAHHTDRDDVGRRLLANAQRAAREQRELTRVECEATLKKARERAVELERDAEQHLKARLAETEQLLRMHNDLRERLKATLVGLLGPVHSHNGRAEKLDVEGGVTADSPTNR